MSEHHLLPDKLEPLSVDELDLYLGKVVYLASKGYGPHWLLKRFYSGGKQVELITPVTRITRAADITDLRKHSFYQKIYFK